MITINGSFGEGGGQVLRSSLSLSLITGKAVHIENVRGGRQKPGLMRQHLTALKAAAAIGHADVTGAELGSKELTFAPKGIQAGEYKFSVGTAGSTTLVLATVLPALLRAKQPSTVILEGGTHNPLAPPFDFFQKALAPLLRQMGYQLEATLERPGFFPAGGGRLRVDVSPGSTSRPIRIDDRGPIKRKLARAIVASLPVNIAERELTLVTEKLGWSATETCIDEVNNSIGPGNVLIFELESKHVTEIFIGFGQQGVKAEQVAKKVIGQVRNYLTSGAPIGPHLADQIMLPMALAAGGSFTTMPLSRHSITNMEVIKMFLNVSFQVTELDNKNVTVEVDR